MRFGILLSLLITAPAFGKGLGIKTEDPKLQAFADLDDDARYAAWKDLVKAGAPSVPTLLAMLREQHIGLRALGGSGLAQVGPLAAKAIPALHAIVKDGSAPANVRLVVITALGNIGPAAAPAVPDLQKLLRSDSKINRITSAVALAKIDPTASGLSDAIAPLIGVGRMETPGALAIAAKLGTRARGCRAAVVEVARGGRSQLERRDALRTLVALDGESEATRAELRKALGDPLLRIRAEAAALLTALGSRDDELNPILRAGIASPDAVIRVVAAVATLRRQHNALDLAPTRIVVEALQGARVDHEGAAPEALRQLRGMGRSGQTFADIVEEIAPRSTAHVEGQAALTLWAITGDRERALKVARHALTRGYFHGCGDVVRLVGE